MIELQKSIDIIKQILSNYYNENEFVYNEEAQLFMCPVGCIEYIEDEWVYSILHSNMINSMYVEEAVLLSMDLIKKGIDLKMSSGQYFIFNDDNELDYIIFSDDVWEYMSMYGVDENFAVTALTAKMMEEQLKGELN